VICQKLLTVCGKRHRKKADRGIDISKKGCSICLFVFDKYGAMPSVIFFETPVIVDNAAGEIATDS
jgi:hypothetical protein